MRIDSRLLLPLVLALPLLGLAPPKAKAGAASRGTLEPSLLRDTVERGCHIHSRLVPAILACCGSKWQQTRSQVRRIFSSSGQ